MALELTLPLRISKADNRTWARAAAAAGCTVAQLVRDATRAHAKRILDGVSDAGLRRRLAGAVVRERLAQETT